MRAAARSREVLFLNQRYLIINADDYGMAENTNTAIEALFDAGAITSATILSPAALAREACETAAARGYAVGVHWTLCAEWADVPWPPCAGKDAASLADEAGSLYQDSAQMAKHAKSAEVDKELMAQYHFMCSHGCPPDHADSHRGSLYGLDKRAFFVNAFRLCRRYHLPFRFPKSPVFLQRLGVSVPGLPALHRGIVLLGSAMKVSLLDDLIFHSPPEAENRDALLAYYRKELAGAPAGISELFMHPALYSESTAARNPAWAQKCQWEYELLQSGAIVDAARQEGFTLVSWKEAPFARSE